MCTIMCTDAEIINEYNYNDMTYGNDCVIYTDIVLEKIRNYYVVVYIKTMKGWFGTQENTDIKTFDIMEEAEKYFDEMKNK